MFLRILPTNSMLAMSGCLLALIACAGVSSTPLDDYVKLPDSHYNWTDTGRFCMRACFKIMCCVQASVSAALALRTMC